jgi:NAD(P)-dependent dehydrogenase (short-subunit alcohol dehydrogenase family)
MNKVAIVTGAASGIGRATSQIMAREGASVVLVDINSKGIDRVASGIIGSGGKALSIKADISKESQIRQMVESVMKEFNRIDILVNNATYPAPASGSPKPFHETNITEWKAEIDTTLFGTLLCCQAVIPHMIHNKYGRIINLASFAGKNGIPFVAIYCAAKAGIAGASRAIARELATSGITVNCISPGTIRTPRTEAIISRNPEQEKRWLTSIPIGKIGEPEDVANMIVFLASDEAKFITGQDYSVDGGQRM